MVSIGSVTRGNDSCSLSRKSVLLFVMQVAGMVLHCPMIIFCNSHCRGIKNQLSVLIA